MMSRDRIKERCRVPTRELLGLVAGTWLAAFLFPPYLGGDDGSAGGPRAGEIRESVSGLCLDGDLGAAAQPGRGPPPKPFAACETGNVCLARGTWNAECIDELCLCPRGTYVDQVDASSGAYNRLAKGPVPGAATANWSPPPTCAGGISTTWRSTTLPATGWRLMTGRKAAVVVVNERKRPACVLFASYLRPLCVPSASCLRPACVLTGAQPYVCPICVPFASYWCHAAPLGRDYPAFPEKNRRMGIF
jgi:hypothetical protein